MLTKSLWYSSNWTIETCLKDVSYMRDMGYWRTIVCIATKNNERLHSTLNSDIRNVYILSAIVGIDFHFAFHKSKVLKIGVTYITTSTSMLLKIRERLSTNIIVVFSHFHLKYNKKYFANTLIICLVKFLENRLR